MIPVVMVIGAIFLAVQSVMGLMTEAQTQRIVNRRLQFKERFETNSEAMIELRKSRGLDKDGNLVMPLRWFNQLVVRSGLRLQPARWFGMSAVGGIVAALAYLHFIGGLPAASGIAFSIFALGPVIGLKFVAGARMKKMSVQLPDALQIVCRSLEAGSNRRRARCT